MRAWLAYFNDSPQLTGIAVFIKQLTFVHEEPDPYEICNQRAGLRSFEDVDAGLACRAKEEGPSQRDRVVSDARHSMARLAGNFHSISRPDTRLMGLKGI
jgi:hypothetical protein